MNNSSTPKHDKQSPAEQGHIYVYDIIKNQINGKTHFDLSVILLHKQPFKTFESQELQRTSLANLKIREPYLQEAALCIENALGACELVHAEVIFQNLKLISDVQNGIPQTSAELIHIEQMVVKYRS